MYASNFQDDREFLWKDLMATQVKYASSGAPWLIVGDFNETLSSSEHSRGAGTRNQSGMRAFQNIVSSCDLTDLPSHGPKFTWANKQSENLIAKNLDRVLINGAWM